jgi:hypothetical protein
VAEALWTPWDGVGLDHAQLRADAAGASLDGLALVMADGAIWRVAYAIACDAQWRVRDVRVSASSRAGQRASRLNADGDGHWTTADGAPLPQLDGCVDVDLAFSPVTNTLPIRRLSLAPGATAELRVVYLTLPELAPVPDGQRYTRLAADRYRYESADDDFRAELPVDAHGLVRDYPGLFRRVG